MKKYTIPAAAALVLIGASCTVKQEPVGDAAETAVATTPATTPVTAPPVTTPPVTAPPVTAPPVTTPPVTAAPAFEYCGVSGPGIGPDTLLSPLDTIGYGGVGSEYCDGFTFVYGLRNDRLVTEVCADNFWVTDDYLYLDVFMSSEGGNHSHDDSVGMIDALWTVCPGGGN